MQFWETTKPGMGYPPEPGFKRRLLYTLSLVLVFRVLAIIPLFNIEEEKLHELLADNPLIGALDLLAGGELLTSFSLVAAGIFPYLLALGLMKAATRLIGPLRELEAKGESGKKRLELITKIITVPLAFVFAWGLTHTLAREIGFFPGKIRWFSGSHFFSTFGIVGAMTAGTLVTMGITSMITKKGLGSGESVILLVGACLGFVDQVLNIVLAAPDPAHVGRQLGVQGGVVLIAAAVSYFLLKAERRVPIRTMKHPTYAGNYLPLLPNHGGVLPISSAVGLLVLLKFGETFLASHFADRFAALQHGLTSLTDPAQGLYWAALGALVALFTFANNFSVLWKPRADSDATLAQDFRQNGFFIPALRPGAETERYLSRLTVRLSWLGALLLVLMAAALPYLVVRFTGENVFVIVVAAFVFVQTLEKLRPEITAHAIEGDYEGFLKPRPKRPVR